MEGKSERPAAGAIKSHLQIVASLSVMVRRDITACECDCYA